MTTTDSLDAAWAEAEAALPEGWELTQLDLLYYPRRLWRAWILPKDRTAKVWDTFETAEAETPAGALRALAAQLRGFHDALPRAKEGAA